MQDNRASVRHSCFDLETAEDCIQTLLAADPQIQTEGVAFSSAGDLLATAILNTNTVFLFRRRPDGRFEDTPCCTLDGREAGLRGPHDLSFCQIGGAQLMAVAERAGAVAFFAQDVVTGAFGPKPVSRIMGPEAQLVFSDGVSFVPPEHDQVAVCNYSSHRIAFFRKTAGAANTFEQKPFQVLRHKSICGPDGLAFSPRGTWLAIANHSNHTVSVFRRWRGILSLGRWRYGPRPVTIIRDPGLRHPHSVAFTADEGHLVVTNAGANHISVYQTQTDGSGAITWSQTPVLQHEMGAEAAFKKINDENPAEGGTKGIALHENTLAVCSPTYGIRIFTLRDTSSERLVHAAPPAGAGTFP